MQTTRQCGTKTFVRCQKKASCLLRAGWHLRWLTLMFSRRGTIASGTEMENVTASPTSYFSCQPGQRMHMTSMKQIQETYYISAHFSSTHMQSEQHALLFLYIVETAVHRFTLWPCIQQSTGTIAHWNIYNSHMYWMQHALAFLYFSGAYAWLALWKAVPICWPGVKSRNGLHDFWFPIALCNTIPCTL